jgi:hypothetical protein
VAPGLRNGTPSLPIFATFERIHPPFEPLVTRRQYIHLPYAIISTVLPPKPLVLTLHIILHHIPHPLSQPALRNLLIPLQQLVQAVQFALHHLQ